MLDNYLLNELSNYVMMNSHNEYRYYRKVEG